MAEEELRIHVRGNFVQVDFVPLVRQKKAGDETSQTPLGTNGSGAGVPNFKKFRPKGLSIPHPGKVHRTRSGNRSRWSCPRATTTAWPIVLAGR